MARRRGAIYLPLEVTFMDDARILDAGEKAAWLYLAMCLKSKQMMSDGVLTVREIERLQIGGWKARLARCIESGLVTAFDGDRWYIPAFLEHNESKEAIVGKLRRDADRKASERNPDGIQEESVGSPWTRDKDKEKTDSAFRCQSHDQPLPCISCAADRKAAG